jgi:hypothetical protein
MTTETTTTEKPVTFRLVYSGIAPVDALTKTTQQVFYNVREDGAPDLEVPRFFTFKRGALAGLRPGAVYEFGGTEQRVTYKKGMMPVEYLKGDIVVQWTASDRANKAAFEARERIVSESHQRPLREALEPIRIAYRRAPLASKAQMLADVVAYIVRNS